MPASRTSQWTVINSPWMDTPNLDLLSDMKSGYVNFSAETYLMYRPAGAFSIYVSLQSVSWGWSGSASRDYDTGVWMLDQEPSPQNWAYGPYSTTKLPTWTNDIRDLPDCFL